MKKEKAILAVECFCGIVSKFYSAENYHQNYLENYPNRYTCHFIRTSWKLMNNFYVWIP